MTALLLLLLQSLSEPDLVIRNARIVTMDDSRPDAEALAIRSGGSEIGSPSGSKLRFAPWTISRRSVTPIPT